MYRSTPALLLIIILSATIIAQQPRLLQRQKEDIAVPSMGLAPVKRDGVGRLDLRVIDADGRPIERAYAKLESRRSDGFTCESWNWSDVRGVAVLPPLHVGDLKLVVKKKGFRTQELSLLPGSLAEPVRVILQGK